MLNRERLLRQMQTVSDNLFLDLSAEYSTARASWNRIAADPLFYIKIRAIKSVWLIPSFEGSPALVIAHEPYRGPYAVLSVDGSQIYPDRHQGVACHLINIGVVELFYGGITDAPVFFDSVPYLFTGEEKQDEELKDAPTELVNCRRQELELCAALERARLLKARMPADVPFVFLIDGSLIFWHLEAKEKEVKNHFLGAYLYVLEQLYHERILHAGYISLPKNKELINLIRVELCQFELQGCQEHHAVDHLVDTTIASFFLAPGKRTRTFLSNAPIGESYPTYAKPYFFYLDVGEEIVRVEIPAWIAQDEEATNLVASLILDQAQKGRGYPVVLAEAHEQAVIKGPDREFFYQLITKIGMEQKQRVTLSQKSMKKRGMGI